MYKNGLDSTELYNWNYIVNSILSKLFLHIFYNSKIYCYVYFLFLTIGIICQLPVLHNLLKKFFNFSKETDFGSQHVS